MKKINKKIIVGLLFVILAVIVFAVVYNISKKDDAINNTINSQEKVIFETNLPDINSELVNNLIISANLIKGMPKNIIIKIVKNGQTQEIKNADIEDILISSYKDTLDNAGKPDLRVLELKNNPEIGIVHEHLDAKYYRNSSGYILDEDSITKRKNLCISTSSVYNNWTCFVFDKEKDNFVLSYAQNFAD